MATGTTPSQAVLSIQVTPALPAGMQSLAAGFEASVFLSGLAVPVKMAFAVDGRLFFNELSTGNIRVVDAGGILQTTPFATVSVFPIGPGHSEQGLIGLALAPDFLTSNFLYVFASVPAGGGHPDRNQILRFTANGNVAAGAPTVIVDDLPIGDVHNSGDVKIGPDGNLYVTLGDVGTAANAQTNGVLPGRVLRYTAAGAIPGDNPVSASDPEWVRGLRNSFDMAFNPNTGGLFASENGDGNVGEDELNFIQKGKNYGWPSLPGGTPGSAVGFRVKQYTSVLAPTGLTFHDGAQWGTSFANNLFLCSYNETSVRRLVLSGTDFTDLDSDTIFASWIDPGNTSRKPLDVLEGPDGALYVSTFSAIWKIQRSP
jgi:glucose/arabinose dehydrogenase